MRIEEPEARERAVNVIQAWRDDLAFMVDRLNVASTRLALWGGDTDTLSEIRTALDHAEDAHRDRYAVEKLFDELRA